METIEMSKDPVCGMAVDDKAALRSTHAGQTYVFCSPACKTKFDKEPGRYAAPTAGDEARRDGGT
ncbi:MAG: YHS domain-containing protein [Thermoanaerobaculia bacterium]